MVDLKRLLYVSDSVCADGEPIVKIVQESRSNNRRDDLTGLLVYDGSRFAQYIEGPAPGISSLHRRLSQDERHTNMEVLVLGELPGQRRFPSWRMGYLKYDLDAFGLEGLRGKRAAAALDAFAFILPTLDLLADDSIPR